MTKDGKKFMIYKFRTMIVDAEKTSAPVLATDRDPRILPIGRLLRATRLDELPQIVDLREKCQAAAEVMCLNLAARLKKTYRSLDIV